MLEYIIVGLIVAAALVYTIVTIYKKIKRLSAPQVGACGHRCDCCPFAKYNGGMPCCDHPENRKAAKKSKSGCCCG
ncbi:MAG: FeoB-associated Cys-rich membrane protein [Proteobacteria bacterium]|nr:FeoB-associated Cys-rich membrane protein [Pseudomonadota bacterium]